MPACTLQQILVSDTACMDNNLVDMIDQLLFLNIGTTLAFFQSVGKQLSSKVSEYNIANTGAIE